MYKYFKIWWLLMVRTAQIALESRLGVIIFLLGKLIRFGAYLFFLIVILSKTQTLAGYSVSQVLLFFATFNFIDTSAQFLLREVYRFRRHIISGYFDYTLLWPISPLFKSLFGGSDVLDIPMILISVGLIIYTVFGQDVTVMGIILYLFLILNAFFIALAFHICVLSLGILTTEIDNTLWMYRDLTQMGRIPIDVYKEPIRGIITFAVPVGIMMTFPVKAILGSLSLSVVILSFSIGLVFVFCSLLFWKYALKRYSSASS